MAPSVSAGSSRTRSRTWTRQQASLAEVMEVLARLDREAAQHDDGDSEHPHPRNCVLNLVAVIPQEHSFRRVELAADQMADHHPLRVIGLRLHGAGGRDSLGARVSSHAHQVGAGRAVQHDQVQLELTGAASRQLRQLVEPLLTPDVTTVVWWEGTPPLDDRAFRELATLAQVLVVDSARFEDPSASVSGLARLARRSRMAIADLEWGRNRGWREALAQAFSPPDRRGFLKRLIRLELDYAAGPGASPVPSCLLAGWLGAQAGLGHSGPHLRETPRGRLRPGDVRELRLSALDGRRRLELAVARDGGHLHLEVAVDATKPLRQVLTVDTPSDAELLIWQTSHGRRDEVFAGALLEAARLLKRAA